MEWTFESIVSFLSHMVKDHQNMVYKIEPFYSVHRIQGVAGTLETWDAAIGDGQGRSLFFGSVGLICRSDVGMSQMTADLRILDQTDKVLNIKPIGQYAYSGIYDFYNLPPGKTFDERVSEAMKAVWFSIFRTTMTQPNAASQQLVEWIFNGWEVVLNEAFWTPSGSYSKLEPGYTNVIL